MIKGKTKSGFVYQLDDEIRDDMEILEGFIDLDNGDMRNLKKVLTQLLGQEQKNALYEHCRVNGRVSAKRVMEELTEILNSDEGDLKN